jgi:translation initiation factor 1
LDIVLDRKGRAGKSATIVCGFGDESDDETITALAAKLKKRLATGGSVRGGEILVQGDRRKEVAELLKAEGYPCRII